MEGVDGLLIGVAGSQDTGPLLGGAALEGLALVAPERARPLAVEASAAGSALLLRQAAIRALGKMAVSDQDAAQTLAGLLEDPSMRIRASALSALEGVHHVSLLPALLRFHEQTPFDDQRAEVRKLLAKFAPVEGN